MNTPPNRASREIRSTRANRRPPSFIVTIIALAIVFALAWMFFVRSGGSTPAPVVNGIEGTYEWRLPAGPDENGAFSAAAVGGAGGRSETIVRFGSPPGVESAYDASRRTERTLEGRPSRVVQTIGTWPPVWRVATRSPLDYQGLAAVVRAAVEDGDDNVGIKPLKQGDRAVWRAAMTVGDKQVTLVVDQETGIVTWYSDGEHTFAATVNWASPPPAGTTYKVEVPAGTPVKTEKDGAVVYVGSPREARARAGYAPLVSDLAPDRYALKAIATRPAGSLPLRWAGIDTGNPATEPRGEATLQLYTSGLSQFTIEQAGPQTLRSMPDLAEQAAAAAKHQLSYQETTLQFGAFKGETALTWYQESGPSLFVAGARRAVFVTGALTRQELIAFAEGLKPVAADTQP